MTWNIVYSDRARTDLRSIRSYIANELCAPEIAAKQVRKIMQKIRQLDEMPMMFKLYDDEPWYSRGLRYFPVDNYLVFYLPVEDEKVVNIVRIMYGRRDISKQLNDNN